MRGWDDPRMPTICGLRRRGYTPEAIRDFCDRIGVAKRDSIVDVALLEHCLREELNRTAPRVMAVLRPLKLVHRQLPRRAGGGVRGPGQPGGPERGHPPRSLLAGPLHRAGRLPRGAAAQVLAAVPGQRSAAALGLPRALHRRREGPGHRRGRRGALHLSTPRPAAATPRTAARSSRPSTGSPPPTPPTPRCASTSTCSRPRTRATCPRGATGRATLNPASAEILTGCKVEPGLAVATAGGRFQFERLGYFVVDPDSAPGRLVFNRSVTLRDTWARIEKSQQ